MQALCEKASGEVAQGQGVRIANFLCPGNYAISGGLEGCAMVEKIAKPDFKVGSTKIKPAFLPQSCSASGNAYSTGGVADSSWWASFWHPNRFEMRLDCGEC